MNSMKRMFTPMLTACAVAFAMIAMSAPAASAAEHPQATALIASTPAAAPAPADMSVVVTAVEQKAIGAFSVVLGVSSPEPGAAHPLGASPSDSASHTERRIHADREAKGRTSI